MCIYIYIYVYVHMYIYTYAFEWIRAECMPSESESTTYEKQWIQNF
jgi:hypothetical protein